MRPSVRPSGTSRNSDAAATNVSRVPIVEALKGLRASTIGTLTALLVAIAAGSFGVYGPGLTGTIDAVDGKVSQRQDGAVEASAILLLPEEGQGIFGGGFQGGHRFFGPDPNEPQQAP